MRLLFLILAHDRPEQTVELAKTLVEAARDGVAMIHYDSRSAPAARGAARARRRRSRACGWSRSVSPAAGAASGWSRRP